MAFMKPEITTKQEWAGIETTAGFWWVPLDVLSKGEIESARRGDFGPLLKYTEGNRVYDDLSSLKKGYGVRLSASGYMDATDWEVYGSLKEAQRRVKELIKEEEEEGTPAPGHATRSHATKKTRATATRRSTSQKSPAQLDREIAKVLAKPSARHRSSHAIKAGRHGYDNGQRVTVLDYLGREIGTGRVRSGDNYPESNEYFTYVTMTRHGETVTQEYPTRQVVMRQ